MRVLGTTTLRLIASKTFPWVATHHILYAFPSAPTLASIHRLIPMETSDGLARD
jgi:hypothetical protein